MANGDLDSSLRLSSYDYDLPPELIAQEPIEPRDSARLLVLHRATGAIEHRFMRDLPLILNPGDLIVANRSRVLQARLFGKKVPSGGRVEITLLRPIEAGTWEALTKGHRLQAGQQVELDNGTRALIGDPTPGGRAVHFPGTDVYSLLEEAGHTPLPPYIHGYRGDPQRYQTVYADDLGSAAAPTAGLHFTPDLLSRLEERRIGWASVVLHIGLDTFQPITEENVLHHHIHTEWLNVSEDVVQAVQQARAAGGRVIAVGTSSVRSLEFAARPSDLRAYQGPVDLFVTPGHKFQVVDALLTNFHMPRTSVLLLVAAFAGREQIFDAYEKAKRAGYRFLSFGDGMLIL